MLIDELVGRVDQYLDGDDSLEEFERWFYDLAFDIERRKTGRGVDLVHEIEGILAEASSAAWSRSDLNAELDFAVQKHRQHLRVLRVGNEAAWRARSWPLLQFPKVAL